MDLAILYGLKKLFIKRQFHRQDPNIWDDCMAFQKKKMCCMESFP